MSGHIDLRQLAARESEQVEWKGNVADIDDVVETLSAFANDLANLGGGYVVCGAAEMKDDHGFPSVELTGLTPSRLREVEGTVLTRCRERVSPPLAPRVEELPAATPDRRILAFIMASTDQAHMVRRGAQGARYFVRIGRETREARDGILRPRNFALLLFGRSVQRFVPGAFSLFSSYPGLDRSEPHAERQELAGNLLEQAYRLAALLEQQAVTAFDKTDPTNPNALKYPSRALREVMINALAHRDYSLGPGTK